MPNRNKMKINKMFPSHFVFLSVLTLAHFPVSVFVCAVISCVCWALLLFILVSFNFYLHS